MSQISSFSCLKMTKQTRKDTKVTMPHIGMNIPIFSILAMEDQDPGGPK